MFRSGILKCQELRREIKVSTKMTDIFLQTVILERSRVDRVLGEGLTFMRRTRYFWLSLMDANLSSYKVSYSESDEQFSHYRQILTESVNVYIKTSDPYKTKIGTGSNRIQYRFKKKKTFRGLSHGLVLLLLQVGLNFRQIKFYSTLKQYIGMPNCKVLI